MQKLIGKKLKKLLVISTDLIMTKGNIEKCVPGVSHLIVNAALNSISMNLMGGKGKRFHGGMINARKL